MKPLHSMLFASADTGLIAHWQNCLGIKGTVANSFEKIANATPKSVILWLDMNLPGLPLWTDARWGDWLKSDQLKIVAASSSPKDDEGIVALDAGCAAYCHAFSDEETLLQVKQVVQLGHVWIGVSLMQRLIRGAGRIQQAVVKADDTWSEDLTAREKQVAILAANGASNHLISESCDISERTVKAHLSSVFAKLNITDRLQLALRVHGIS